MEGKILDLYTEHFPLQYKVFIDLLIEIDFLCDEHHELVHSVHLAMLSGHQKIYHNFVIVNIVFCCKKL